jgi:hypothetical protein
MFAVLFNVFICFLICWTVFKRFQILIWCTFMNVVYLGMIFRLKGTFSPAQLPAAWTGLFFGINFGNIIIVLTIKGLRQQS